MENIKAVFFDIDGTLLDMAAHRISRSTKTAVLALQEKGYKVGIATARPISTAADIPDIFFCQWDGMVTGMGLEVRNKEKELIQQKCLDADTRDEIYDILQKNHIPVYGAGEETFLTERNEITDKVVEYFGIDYPPVKAYTGQKEQLLTIMTPDHDKVDTLIGHLEGIDLVHSSTYCTDVFVKGVTKDIGIRQLMKYWGFAPHEYMCFGDTPADEAMLKGAAYSVCMHHAPASTQAVADYVCPENSEDSIYNCLKDIGMI